MSRSAAQRTSTSPGPVAAGQRQQQLARRAGPPGPAGAAALRAVREPLPQHPGRDVLAVDARPTRPGRRARAGRRRRARSPSVRSRSGRKRGANTTLLVTAASRSAPGASNGASSRSSQSGSGVASLLSSTAYGVVTCAQGGVVAAGEAEVAVVAQHPHAAGGRARAGRASRRCWRCRRPRRRRRTARRCAASAVRHGAEPALAVPVDDDDGRERRHAGTGDHVDLVRRVELGEQLRVRAGAAPPSSACVARSRSSSTPTQVAEGVPRRTGSRRPCTRGDDLRPQVGVDVHARAAATAGGGPPWLRGLAPVSTTSSPAAAAEEGEQARVVRPHVRRVDPEVVPEHRQAAGVGRGGDEVRRRGPAPAPTRRRPPAALGRRGARRSARRRRPRTLASGAGAQARSARRRARTSWPAARASRTMPSSRSTPSARDARLAQQVEELAAPAGQLEHRAARRTTAGSGAARPGVCSGS